MDNFGYGGFGGFNNFNNMNMNYDYQLYAARMNERRLLKKNASILGVLLLLYELLCYVVGRVTLFIIVYIHSGVLAFPIGSRFNNILRDDDFYFSTTMNMGFSCIVVGVAVIALLLIARIGFKIDLTHIYRFEKGQGKTIAVCFPAVMLTNLALATIIGLVVSYLSSYGITVPQADFSYNELTASAFATQIIYGVIIAPIAEETLYRGLAIHLLKPYGKGMAVIISSLVFGLMHENIPQAVNAFCFGLVMGTITVSCNSVVPTIVVHMLNNALAQIPDIADIIGADAMYQVYYAIAILSLVIGLYIIFAHHRKIRLPKDENCVMMKGERYKTAMLCMPMVFYWLYLAYQYISSFIYANI